MIARARKAVVAGLAAAVAFAVAGFWQAAADGITGDEAAALAGGAVAAGIAAGWATFQAKSRLSDADLQLQGAERVGR